MSSLDVDTQISLLDGELECGEFANIETDETIISLWDRTKIMDHVSVIRVPNEDRITSHVLQLEEMTEAIGIRASQIERGALIFCDYEGITDPKLIARKELAMRRNPLILERKMQTIGSCIYVEHWKVSEMTYIDLDLTALSRRRLAQDNYKMSSQF